MSNPENAAMNDFNFTNFDERAEAILKTHGCMCQINGFCDQPHTEIVEHMAALHIDKMRLQQKLQTTEQSLECGQKDMDYLRGRLEAVERERDGLQHMNKLMHERCHELEHGAPPVGHCIYEQNKSAESELRAAREVEKKLSRLREMRDDIISDIYASHTEYCISSDGCDCGERAREVESLLADPGGTSGGEGVENG